MITDWSRAYVAHSGGVGDTIAHAVIWGEVRRLLWTLPGAVGVLAFAVAVLYLASRRRGSR